MIYRRFITRMIQESILPVDQLLVVPDPGGRRVGSGGATLEALHAAARVFSGEDQDRSLESRFEGRRVAIVHSGGESRRLPAFAGIGKVLMPIGIDGRGGGPRTMLETILDALVERPGPEDGQLVVTSGDAFTPPRWCGPDRRGPSGCRPVRVGRSRRPARGLRRGSRWPCPRHASEADGHRRRRPRERCDGMEPCWSIPESCPSILGRRLAGCEPQAWNARVVVCRSVRAC